MASERGSFQNRGPRGRGNNRGGSTNARGNSDSQRSRDNGYGARAERTGYDPTITAPTNQGSFSCDYHDPNPPSSSYGVALEPYHCNFKCHTPVQLMLHKADRHLVYPPGGLQELKRHDPMLVAEEKERLRRQRQSIRSRAQAPHSLPSRPGSSAPQANSTAIAQQEDSDDESADQHGKALDGPPDATIAGLNIQLDSPELIAEWINQRKKRWPTRQVVEEKRKQKEERQKRSELVFGTRVSGVKRPRSFNDSQGPSDEPPSSKFTKSSSPSTASRLKTGNNSDSDSDEPPEEVNTNSVKQQDPISEEGASSSDDNISSEITKRHAGEESNSGSAPEEESSKTPVAPLTYDSNRPDDDRRPVCKHFLQGRCTFGDRCRKRHASSATAEPSTSQPQKPRRPQPRPPLVNPFDQPDLLRQLLRNEIDKHVDAVGQAIRFIVENDMLLHVEAEEGQAEAQKARRSLVQIVSTSEQTDSEQAASNTGVALAGPVLDKPLVEGGLAIMRSDVAASQPRTSLFRPRSPDLRPLSELRYPPEPDPLIFLDPLRRDDPKPLLPAQLVRIAKDTVIRSVLTPSSLTHPNGEKLKGLERAIVSLDALPSELHRNAALEMILGVSGGTPTPGTSAGLVVKSRDGRRKISESDLFRMGLRVGSDEILSIKKLADRLTFLLDTTLQLDQAETQDWSLLDAEQRDQMRRQHFAKEADRLQRLRKLGIDV